MTGPFRGSFGSQISLAAQRHNEMNVSRKVLTTRLMSHSKTVRAGGVARERLSLCSDVILLSAFFVYFPRADLNISMVWHSFPLVACFPKNKT